MKKYLNGNLVDLTAEEITQQKQDTIKYAEIDAEKKLALKEKENKKASAVTKLKALGLTEEEVKALIGV
jgi:hypothetical protein